MIEKDSKIYIAGHTGLAGSAILNSLKKNNYNNLIYSTSSEIDLTNQRDVYDYFDLELPEYVFLAAAKVGGIKSNITYPADFIRVNLQIQTNIISACHKFNIRKLIFLGSSCVYPRNCKQPMLEEYISTGEFEPTNKSYAIAKLAGIEMCQSYNKQYSTNYISIMPPNLYGPNDNFSLENGHVLSSLIRKIYEANVKRLDYITLWGSGNARREFMYVEDFAECVFYLANILDSNVCDLINIGVGYDISIYELAKLISNIIGFRGYIVFDNTKLDGMPQKLLDITKLNNLGWKSKVTLKEGLSKAYQWFSKNYPIIRR